ncbi:MAG: FAD-dependent oxidoreductase, partial [Limisphaerales bacterium]
QRYRSSRSRAIMNFFASSPVIANPDVCIVGGGAAGVSAAVACGRLGLKTLLLEKYGFCGGATVAGLSGTICGLYGSGKKPEQIVFGFAGEFHQRLAAVGGAYPAIPFGHTKLVPHDSFLWKFVADQLLAESNVQMLFHAYFLGAEVDEAKHIRGLFVKLLEGFRTICPRMVIDASGDAIVVHSIGGKTSLGRNGIVQAPTMIFRLGGVDMPKFFALPPNEICEAVEVADRSMQYRLPRHHVYIFPMPNHREVLCNMTRITFSDGRVPMGISSDDMTFAEQEGRRQAIEYARFLKDRFAAFRDSYLVETGAQVGIRQTRSIHALKRLTNEDVVRARKYSGAMAHSAWPIEAHGAGKLEIVHLNDNYYEVPFETLVPQSGSNLIVAGRCLDAEHEALASVRVTAQCFSMGYAAGAAAHLAITEKIPTQALTGERVVAWMNEHGLKTSHER